MALSLRSPEARLLPDNGSTQVSEHPANAFRIALHPTEWPRASSNVPEWGAHAIRRVARHSGRDRIPATREHKRHEDNRAFVRENPARKRHDEPPARLVTRRVGGRERTAPNGLWQSGHIRRFLFVFSNDGWRGTDVTVNAIEFQAEEFERHRPHLRAVAYRMLGSLSDADDVVQEAWLRLNRSDAAVENMRGWLTTVVARLSLDELRARR
jgi:Sigma-70 region 2